MSKKEVGLPYERAIELFKYDAETGVLERKLKNGEWRVCGHKPNNHGYGRVRIGGKKYFTHRLAWLLTYGSWPEHEIDHISRDKLDNRLENLRVATRAENQHNHGLRRDNSSGYPGVSFNRPTNKYKAEISLNGKRIYLGYYPSAEEAHVAYMLAKIQHHPTSPIAQEYIRELTLAG